VLHKGGFELGMISRLDDLGAPGHVDATQPAGEHHRVLLGLVDRYLHSVIHEESLF